MDFLASTTDIPAVIACMHATKAMSADTNHPISSHSSRESLTVATTSGTKTASTVEAKSPMTKYGMYLIDIILGHHCKSYLFLTLTNETFDTIIVKLILQKTTRIENSNI